MTVHYPGFCRQSGQGASVAIMLIAATALYFVFKRKDWLWADRGRLAAGHGKLARGGELDPHHGCAAGS
jgi:hypothetical protein